MILEVPKTSSVSSLKSLILESWPTIPILNPPPSPDRIRLICMGRGLMQPPTASVGTFGLPKFATHPTPVNCSIRPEQVAKAGGKEEKKKKTSAASGVAGIFGVAPAASASAPAAAAGAAPAGFSPATAAAAAQASGSREAGLAAGGEGEDGRAVVRSRCQCVIF